MEKQTKNILIGAGALAALYILFNKYKKDVINKPIGNNKVVSNEPVPVVPIETASVLPVEPVVVIPINNISPLLEEANNKAQIANNKADEKHKESYDAATAANNYEKSIIQNAVNNLQEHNIDIINPSIIYNTQNIEDIKNIVTEINNKVIEYSNEVKQKEKDAFDAILSANNYQSSLNKNSSNINTTEKNIDQFVLNNTKNTLIISNNEFNATYANNINDTCFEGQNTTLYTSDNQIKKGSIIYKDEFLTIPFDKYFSILDGNVYGCYENGEIGVVIENACSNIINDKANQAQSAAKAAADIAAAAIAVKYAADAKAKQIEADLESASNQSNAIATANAQAAAYYADKAAADAQAALSLIPKKYVLNATYGNNSDDVCFGNMNINLYSKDINIGIGSKIYKDEYLTIPFDKYFSILDGNVYGCYENGEIGAILPQECSRIINLKATQSAAAAEAAAKAANAALAAATAQAASDAKDIADAKAAITAQAAAQAANDAKAQATDEARAIFLKAAAQAELDAANAIAVAKYALDAQNNAIVASQIIPKTYTLNATFGNNFKDVCANPYQHTLLYTKDSIVKLNSIIYKDEFLTIPFNKYFSIGDGNVYGCYDNGQIAVIFEGKCNEYISSIQSPVVSVEPVVTLPVEPALVDIFTAPTIKSSVESIMIGTVLGNDINEICASEERTLLFTSLYDWNNASSWTGLTFYEDSELTIPVTNAKYIKKWMDNRNVYEISNGLVRESLGDCIDLILPTIDINTADQFVFNTNPLIDKTELGNDSFIYFSFDSGTTCWEFGFGIPIKLQLGAKNICSSYIIYADFKSYGDVFTDTTIYVKEKGTDSVRIYLISSDGQSATAVDNCSNC